MKVFSLSASKIKSYKMCQFKYMLEYHLGLSTGTSFAAEQGNMVHVLFELAGQDIRDGKKPEDSYIINNWRKEVLYAYQQEGLWKLDPKVKDQERNCLSCEHHMDGFCNLANLSLDDFEGCPLPQYQDAIWLTERVMNHGGLEYPLDENRKILDVEDRFRLEIPDGNDTVIVNGIIDVVTELDGKTVEIVDYKTGRYKMGYAECQKDPQLLIYNLAAQQKWRGYENFIITIYYLRTKPLHLTFGEKDLRGTELALKHYFHMISANDSPMRIRDKPYFNRRDRVICEKMCDMKLCDQEFAKFRANGCQVLPPPEKPPNHRKEWLAHLHEGSQKAQAFKDMKNAESNTAEKEKTKGSTGSASPQLVSEIPILGRKDSGSSQDHNEEGEKPTHQDESGCVDGTPPSDG